MQIINSPEDKLIVLKSPAEEWTQSYLVDNLKQQLATVELSKSKIPTDLLDTPNDKFNTYFCLISNRHYVNQSFPLSEDWNI